ncbi:thermostable hemolysin [Mesoterricola silvestris]|uniref:Thermostable hemolysin n=1 Tax=Mesoterricola silvestris TaxID=2927979 RepID=A0AA48GK66_9BACT|nr:thermostable hemolysin [Mesoterricola silvestris]BDU74531.1 thermostable hemolysin [Mesoterricola silvestris]
MNDIATTMTFHLITTNSPGYESIISIIKSAYARAFQASVDPRPALLLTLTEETRDATDYLACVAFSQGKERPFFSEQYLPAPAEIGLSQALGREVRRDQILEVGSLASRRNGAGMHLVSHTPWFVLGLGYRYGLVTATRQVRHLIRSAGMEFVPLAAATREALPETDQAQWGSYYEHAPLTGVIDFLASFLSVAIHRNALHRVQEMTLSVQELKVS